MSLIVSGCFVAQSDRNPHFVRVILSPEPAQESALAELPAGGILACMDRDTAIQTIRQRVLDIAADVTAIHPCVPALNDAPTQAELLKALFELTKQVEVVKKHLLKLEKRDDSSLL